MNIIAALVHVALFFTSIASAASSCATWMIDVSSQKTDAHVLAACSTDSFITLSHEYAKDADTVFFKPMPNANNYTVILPEADAASFGMAKGCNSLAVDKNHVFYLGQIRKGVKPADIPPCW